MEAAKVGYTYHMYALRFRRAANVSQQPRPFSAWRLAGLAGMAVAVAACQLPTADFTAYSGTNLIPEAQFDAWTPDQNLGSAPGNQYMNFERLDNLSAAGFATATGFADLAALYDTLPAAANTAAGALPPVYRLEIRNLFKNGDFEDSTPGTTVQTGSGDPNILYEIPGHEGRIGGHNSLDAFNRERTIMTAAETQTRTKNNLASGQALCIRQFFLDWTRFDLSQNLAYWDAAGASYNLGFHVYLLDPLDYYLSVGSETDDATLLRVYGKAANSVLRFPQQMANDSATGTNSSFYASAANKYLYINPLQQNQSQIGYTAFDDFQVVRTDKTYAVRYEVPKLTAAKLSLVQGGTYTLTLWVRNDPTAAAGNANKAKNRYPASRICISIMDDLTMISGNRVLFNVPGNGDWTMLTASFTNLLFNATKFDRATDSDKLLQITVVPADTTSDVTQFPGSLLVASPRLVFSPDVAAP
jgi:hypothetical protein